MSELRYPNESREYRNAREALLFSVGVTFAALALFGYIKGRFTGAKAFRSALETLIIGGLAAAAAFALSRHRAASAARRGKAEDPGTSAVPAASSRKTNTAAACG